jgi:hypothetical protein
MRIGMGRLREEVREFLSRSIHSPVLIIPDQKTYSK